MIPIKHYKILWTGMQTVRVDGQCHKNNQLTVLNELKICWTLT